MDAKLKDSLRCAVDAFKERHDDQMPTNYVIYRDGVGDAQRDAVIRIEMTQFREAIKQLYPEETKAPELTLVVVNKRIN